MIYPFQPRHRRGPCSGFCSASRLLSPGTRLVKAVFSTSFPRRRTLCRGSRFGAIGRSDKGEVTTRPCNKCPGLEARPCGCVWAKSRGDRSGRTSISAGRNGLPAPVPSGLLFANVFLHDGISLPTSILVICLASVFRLVAGAIDLLEVTLEELNWNPPVMAEDKPARRAA